MSTKQLMIVDCDCGVDDALALFLALAYKETWRILAITCCHGNTTVDNVCDNVRKVLQLCGETKIPVYRGCDRALVKTADLRLVHGNDGFGNMAHEYPHDQINIEKEHAINALVTLAKRHSQEGVHLVVLGPMTNVATAHRYDPEFTKNLKSIHFMGGNIHGVDSTTSSAEFNFACDPEAANIVLTEFKCPMTMVPWETTAKHYMSWIPVYKGCKGPFVKNAELKIFHGKDGLGNVARAYPHDQIQIADGHAVSALVHIAKTYRQEGIHLVVLGPMTNIAMAHRLDPEFTKNLKSIYFMGGNIHGVGNVTSAAEFNFACDPEAAHIIVTESICPVTMIPWETTIRHGMSWEFYEKLVNERTTISKFIKDTSKILAHECKSDNLTFVDCDFMAVASLVSPSCIKTVEKHPISVETTGRVTSGQVVIERFYHANATPKILNIVTELHDSVLNDLRKQIVHQEQKSEI